MEFQRVMKPLWVLLMVLKSVMEFQPVMKSLWGGSLCCWVISSGWLVATAAANAAATATATAATGTEFLHGKAGKLLSKFVAQQPGSILAASYTVPFCMSGICIHSPTSTPALSGLLQLST